METGTFTPARGSSVRGSVKVSTAAMPSAAVSRARKGRQLPPGLYRLQNGGVIEVHRRGGAQDSALGDEWRDDNGRHPDPEPGEVESELSHTRIGGDRPGRGGHMVVTPAVLIVGDDKKCLSPCRRTRA